MRMGRPNAHRPRSVCDALRHARRSLCNRLERMAGLPDDAFCNAFGGIVTSVEAGFRHEELILEMLGYGSLRTHRADNAMILRALHRALPAVDAGDCALGRQLVVALADLLALHRLNTDLALALGHGLPAATGAGTGAGIHARRRAARPAARGTVARRGLR